MVEPVIGDDSCVLHLRHRSYKAVEERRFRREPLLLLLRLLLRLWMSEHGTEREGSSNCSRHLETMSARFERSEECRAIGVNGDKAEMDLPIQTDQSESVLRLFHDSDCRTPVWTLSQD